MKNIILIAIALLMIACKKQEVEQVEPQAPVDVYYKVKGSRNTAKHITCYLWNSNQNHETLELVGKIDTIITSPEAVLNIIQDHTPYIYAKVSFEVEVLEGSDNLSIEVSHGSCNKVLLERYASCQVNTMNFQNEYVELYRENQKKVAR